MSTQLISISTTRYSAVFQRNLTEYSVGTVAEIDGRVYPASEFPRLIEHWCTNERICSTREFILRLGHGTLFGFHDHPDELWAAETELKIVEQLASERIIRYPRDRIAPASLVRCCTLFE